ncbi:hypothetical protein O0L34_g1626 [Tuta absoluta]|nr:hypothetical protein O0L34_g1626 [Tuta absoluta]WMP40231.1 UDP-glucuronosyltransferase UGT34A22 [Tuta absoluta]
MGLKVFKILLLAFFCYVAESANILALFSSLSFSDHLVFRGYVSRLSRAGHSVVVMTAYPGHHTASEVERIIELDVSQESLPFWNEWLKLVTNTDDHFTRMRAINDFSIKLAIAQLKSKQMTALFVNPNVKFDLVITEADVPLLYAAADKYKVPHVAITTSSGKIHQYEAKGSPTHPILYLDVNTMSYGSSSNWQKLTEFKRYIQTKYEYYNNYLPLCEIAAQNIFDLKRSLSEVESDIDLLLVSANPVLNGNRPSSPSIVYTDRLHLKPGFNLPQNLKSVLDAATKGVIYFSIGAIQESETLAPQLLQTLADAFRELPYTVLWKIGNTTAFNKPDNVIAGAWFPQQEILAHPNVKVFITHGGPRALEEAIFYEVPIVGLPIVRPRIVFMAQVTKHGCGEILDPYVLNKDELKTTIEAVANNEKYKKSITKLKSIIVDPLISGPDNAVWWTEYILRNGGARHLASPAYTGAIEYYLLDVISTFLGEALLILCVSFFLLRWIIKRLRARFFGRVIESGKFKAL